MPTGERGFAGGYRTVGGMYHFGQRFYDPDDMRWTQTDPLDQTGDLLQGNRYGHAGGDPIDSSDLAGWSTVGVGCSAAAGGGGAVGISEKSHQQKTARWQAGGAAGWGGGCNAMAWSGGNPKTSSGNVTVCAGVCVGVGTSGVGIGGGIDLGVTGSGTEPVKKFVSDVNPFD